MFPYQRIKISVAVGCRLCARRTSDAVLPPWGPFAGHHLYWDLSPLPVERPERGWFLPSGVDLTPSCPQGAFPARLKKVFIVGAPMWFRVPYSIISLLLKEKLRERVSTGPPGTGPSTGRAEAVFSLGGDGVSSLCPSAPSAGSC